MSLLQEHQIETSVYLCSFECLIRQANIAMKFPCSYFVEWRTINSKASARTNRHPPRESQVSFEETISLQLEMLYDHAKLEFLKRETIIELYLVSKSRPDQNKLVGRVNIDLGKVVNVGMYEEPTEFRLNFCSVEGSLIMQFRPIEQQLTSLTIQDLDKSSFIDFISQSTLKNQTKNQSMILPRHENNSLDKDRNGRSEIRGRSPGSPKGVLKSSIVSKSNHFKQDYEVRESFNPREGKTQLNKSTNEEPQGKPRAGLVNSKVNFNMNNLFEQEDVPPQNKRSEGKRPSELVFLDVIPQDDIVTSQTYDLQNILKTSSSPIFETHSPNIASNEIREAYGSLTFGQQQRMSMEINQSEVKSSRQQMLHAETQKLQSQVSKLLDQNELLFQQKQKSDQRYQDASSALEATKLQFRELQQKNIEKDRALDKISAQATDKDRLIQQLQTQIHSIYQTNKRQQNFQVENLKAKLSLFEALTKQLNDNTKASAASYQKKLINYEQIISQLQKDKEQLQKQKEDSEQKLNAYAGSQSVLKTRLDDLQTENNQLANCLQLTRKQLQEHTNTNLKQSVDLEQQAKDRNEHTMEVQRLNQELDSALAKYDQIEKELGEIQGKYMELESLYDEQVSANQQLQLQIHELQVTKQQQKEQMPQQQQFLNRSEVLETIQPQQNKEQVQKLKLENEQLSNEVEFLKSHTEMNEQVLNNALEGLRHEKESLLEQIFTLETNMGTATINFEAKITQLLTSNGQLFSDNQSLKSEIAQLNRQLYQNEWMETEKALQEENEYLREQARVVEGQVQLYEKELQVLKEEIIRIRESREGKLDKVANEEMLGRLNANLEEQINQNTELSETIVRYMEKEAKMKETLAVLERESKEIFTLVQEKEQNEETYQKAIEQLQVELLSLRNQQPSPTHSKQSSPQRERQEDNADLVSSIKQQQETIDKQNEELTKLNEQLMQLSLQYGDQKARLESEVSHLTDSLIMAQAQSKREEETYAIKCKDYERSIKNRDIQLEIIKSRNKQRETAFRGLENEILRLKSSLEQIEQLKFNLQSTNNEKDIRIIELHDEVESLNKNSAPRAPPPNQQSLARLSMLEELKERLLQKNLNADWDSLLQSILDRSMNGEETGRLLNLQEKSRLLSKELQKMKAQLLKSEWRNQQQKVAAMGLFKKCESIVVQLIAAAESLNQNQSSFL